ncbi:hypothetical protein [Nostoc sp. ChiSLP03a]|uniref:hypothetical protein n=1 Tax=Nostoc sp. ChiSLP03a TaxID=3075380 RepID=UPI002AD2CAB2|nr:hypothetical protein [Nostoc sp. ChiSLP03a]MDZ8214707.1 hypothetical protein [Nostoc sp. ChiSLP03a]
MSSSLFLTLLASANLATTSPFVIDVSIQNGGTVQQEHAMHLLDSELKAQLPSTGFASNLGDKLNSISTHGLALRPSFIREGCGYFAQIQVPRDIHATVSKSEVALSKASAVDIFQAIFG